MGANSRAQGKVIQQIIFVMSAYPDTEETPYCGQQMTVVTFIRFLGMAILRCRFRNIYQFRGDIGLKLFAV